MHRKFVSILRMELELQPEGAVAILSGEKEEQKEGGQLLKLMRAKIVEGRNLKEVTVLPGSSLKGVVRSHCERIARSLGLWCCNPFNTDISETQQQRQEDLANPEKFCGRKIEKAEELSGAERYHSYSCRICRLFGSTGIGSHFFLSDALPRQGSSVSTAQRPHVAIDRALGSVAGGALWYEEVVETGRFLATLELRNFELWQLGLIALALRDLKEGRIRMGHSKSRGYGRVKLTVNNAELRYYGFSLAPGALPNLERIAFARQWPLKTAENLWRLYGIGALLNDEERLPYGYRQDDSVDIPLAGDSGLQPRSEWPLVCIPFSNYERQLLPFLEQCVTQKLSAAVREDTRR
ncbi:MAG: hypothetical protein HYZ50_18480 [Deltaproteobacteria bacterium]|nr:hypothetical protein [Deltaproteobacteria bacterium]